MSDLSQLPPALVPPGTGAASSGERPGKSDAFAWPTPPNPAYPAPVRQTAPEPCEVESPQGRVTPGTLMVFNPAAGMALVRMANGQRTLTLKFGQFRRLSLLRALTPLPTPPDETTPLLPRRGLSHCRLQWKDGAKTQFSTVGYTETPAGLFTFRPLDDDGSVERSFFPMARLDGYEVGDMPPAVAAEPAAAEAACDQADDTVPLPLPMIDGDQDALVASFLADPPGAPQAAAAPSPPAPPELALALALEVEPSVGPTPAAPDALELTLVTSNLPHDRATPAAGQDGPAAPPTPVATALAVAPLSLVGQGPAEPSAAADETRPRSLGEVLGAQDRIDTAEQLMAAIAEQARMPMVRIGEALLALGYITEAKLGDALQAQSRDRSLPLGELLVRRGDITRTDLQTALARKMGYPIVDPATFPAESEAALRLPVALARRLTALPLILRNGQLIVALEDPSARNAIDEIEFSAQCKVVTVLSRAGTLAQAIERVYVRLGKEDIEPSADLVNALHSDSDDSSRLLATLEQSADTGAEDDPQIEQSDNSLVRLINTMILEARAQGVSDIHIECAPSPQKVRVRFRKDGVLANHIELPHTYRSALVARLKIMCDLDISERRKPQDGKINFGKYVQGQRLELRVATIPTANGLEDVVMRLLASAKGLPLEAMGLHPETLAKLKAVVARPYGMVLCVGPTGSGKTTTLHAALAHINTPDRKIWTAEDPVEITQAGLRQVQVNPKIDWTFAKALRAFLRADPDVVMVGEIRDAETAHMAIEASLTGHMVMSTLHTNSAPETVTRLLDMGMDPFSFADSLLAVLAQRLVRRWCKHCVVTAPADFETTEALLDEYLHAFANPADRPDRSELRNAWLQQFGQDGRLIHHHAAGCPKCGNSGYGGRVGLHELLVVSRDLRRMIQTSARAEELQRQGMIEGMRTLRQDGILKVLAGLTSIEEVRATSNG